MGKERKKMKIKKPKIREDISWVWFSSSSKEPKFKKKCPKTKIKSPKIIKL